MNRILALQRMLVAHDSSPTLAARSMVSCFYQSCSNNC